MSYLGRDAIVLSTAVASNDATVEFTDPGTGRKSWANFIALQVILNGVTPATETNSSLVLRVSTDGGSTFATSGYQRALAGIGTDNATFSSASSSSGAIILLLNVGSATDEKGSGFIDIFDPSNTLNFTTITGLAFYENTSGVGRQQHMGGQYRVVTAVDAIQFLFGSDNIESGDFTLLGIRR